MPSATFIVLDYVCPSIGVILASLTFAAPVTSLRDAIAKGSLGDLNPTPWAFMTGNCLGWVAYSYLTKDLFVLAANVPGLMVSIWLNMGAVKLQYREYYDERIRGREGESAGAAGLAALPPDAVGLDAGTNSNQDHDSSDGNSNEEMEFVPATVPHENKVLRILFLWVAVCSAVAHVNTTRQMKEEIIGVIVNVNLTFFYGAPLSTIAEVLRTRSSASIHVRTTSLMIANSAFWLAYGVAIFDPLIYVPNGVGFAFGLLQALLLAVFPSKGMIRVGDGSDLSDVLLDEDDADAFESDAGGETLPPTNETNDIV